MVLHTGHTCFKYCKFSSVQITLIIPQGAILLWSWRARKIIIHKVKRTIQQTQHQQKSLTLTIVIVIRVERIGLVAGSLVGVRNYGCSFAKSAGGMD